MKLFAVCCTLAGLVCAAAPPPPKDARPVVSQAQVNVWTKSWQDVLSLNDWTITTQIVRASSLNPDTLGHLKWDIEKKTALISVLDPLDYQLPPDAIPRDMEFTVLHELVHLRLGELPRSPASRDTEERVVNQIATALFKLQDSHPPRVPQLPTAATEKSKAPDEASRSAH